MALGQVNQELLELQTAIEAAKAELYKEQHAASLAAAIAEAKAAAEDPVFSWQNRRC